MQILYSEKSDIMKMFQNILQNNKKGDEKYKLNFVYYSDIILKYAENKRIDYRNRGILWT